MKNDGVVNMTNDEVFETVRVFSRSHLHSYHKCHLPFNVVYLCFLTVFFHLQILKNITDISKFRTLNKRNK